jgi:hypothetical protein
MPAVKYISVAAIAAALFAGQPAYAQLYNPYGGSAYTQPLGNGYITNFGNGGSAYTAPLGNGYTTQFSNGGFSNTMPLGQGAITTYTPPLYNPYGYR